MRNIWTNLAVYHLNLWMHTLVELWSWNRPREKLCDRSLSPWDDAERRPSHADRRKALRRQIMEHELSTLAAVCRLPRKILQLTKRLMTLACNVSRFSESADRTLTKFYGTKPRTYTRAITPRCCGCLT